MTNPIKKPKVWFITGASSGLGYEFTKKALDSGDKVVGVPRNPETLNDFNHQYKETGCYG